MKILNHYILVNYHYIVFIFSSFHYKFKSYQSIKVRMINIKLTMIILISLVYLSYCQQFDPKRFRLVDSNTGHYFVRGNVPIRNNTFVFEQLYGQLSKFTNTSGYRLVIISLLNLFTAKQTKSRYIQQNFFDHEGKYKFNTTYHYYKNHDILGSYFAAGELPPIVRKYALKYYNYTTYDDVPQIMEEIRKAMHSPFHTIVYVHCSQGVDRAGYVAGAYKMTFKNATMAEVVRENLTFMKEIRNYIHFNSFNGLQWYCLHLGRSEEECLVHVLDANKLKSIQP